MKIDEKINHANGVLEYFEIRKINDKQARRILTCAKQLLNERLKNQTSKI